MNIRRRTSRTLAESLAVDVVLAGRDPSATLEREVASRRAVPYPELAALVAIAEAVAVLHRTNHWIARGSAFGSDHALFQQLYEQLAYDVDTLAERAVGLGADSTVDAHARARTVSAVLGELYAPHGVAAADALAERSLAGETFLVKACASAIRAMTDLGSMTPGLRATLESFCERREKALYLLRRRTS